jgi:hypothetical protein
MGFYQKRRRGQGRRCGCAAGVLDCGYMQLELDQSHNERGWRRRTCARSSLSEFRASRLIDTRFQRLTVSINGKIKAVKRLTNRSGPAAASIAKIPRR